MTPAGDGSDGNVGGGLSGWVGWFVDGFPPPLNNDANEREEVVEEEEGILFIVERLQLGRSLSSSFSTVMCIALPPPVVSRFPAIIAITLVGGGMCSPCSERRPTS